MSSAQPLPTDFVGYETLIEFLVSNNILSVEGDLVEIGAFLGGGTFKLSKCLEKEGSSKRLFAMDVFDPNFDWTADTNEIAMASYYQKILSAFEGKSQWDVFLEVTRECNNIVVLKGDSKKISIPTSRLCFGFIDGNHDPEYVESDFYLLWEKPSSKGALAIHDYEHKLPLVTQKVNELVKKHIHQIRETYHEESKHILFLVKEQECGFKRC